MQERSIFLYDYAIAGELPQRARMLTRERVLSDTRKPCSYARRHGNALYMGYEETASTQSMALRTLEEAHRAFSGLRALTEADIQSARAGPP